MKKTLASLLLIALLLTAAAPSALASGGCWLERTRKSYALASGQTGILFSGAGSSGELTDKYGTYPAANAFDGQLRTAWAENRAGFGDGAYLQGTWKALQGSPEVVGVALWAGYQKNEDIYYKNNRPRNITLTVSNGAGETLDSFQLTLDDYRGCQYVYFDNWFLLNRTLTVRITLNSAYGGSKYTDTCVSEMDLLINANAAAPGEGLGDMRVVNCNEWVSLRAAPSTSASRLARVPLGALVRDCVPAASGFVRCTYNGQSGYILAEYLAAAGGGQSAGRTPAATAAPHVAYADSLYALYHGLTEAEYLAFLAARAGDPTPENSAPGSIGGIAVGRAGNWYVSGNDPAAFLSGLLSHDWYEQGSSGIEPLLPRAAEVRLVRSEIYATGAETITNADEYYRFVIFVPYWSGGYDKYDVIFEVGFEVDGGEWAEGRVLGSTRVEKIQ